MDETLSFKVKNLCFLAENLFSKITLTIAMSANGTKPQPANHTSHITRSTALDVWREFTHFVFAGECVRFWVILSHPNLQHLDPADRVSFFGHLIDLIDLIFLILIAILPIALLCYCSGTRGINIPVSQLPSHHGFVCSK
jgi:hypothetical protein